MNLNERERKLVIGLAIVLGLVGVFYVVVKPFLDRGRTIANQLTRAKLDQQDAQTLLTRQPYVTRAWNSMKNTGVLRSDPYEASQQVSGLLLDWAKDTGVSITNMLADPPAQFSETRAEKPESKFKRVNIHVTVVGTTRTLSSFLWKVESTPMVLRIDSIQVNSKKPGTDDLQMVMMLSTLSPIPPPDSDKNAKPGTAQPARNGPVASAAP